MRNQTRKTLVMLFYLTGCILINAQQTLTDKDGNIYNTLTFGTQVWMKENLKTTKYSDSTLIPNVTNNILWQNNTAGAYSWYNNDPATYKATYGALYNWYTVNTGKLCPSGWHVPSDEEWTNLTDYLINNGFGYGGSGDDIAKSMAATTGYLDCSVEGTCGNDPASNNSSGFTAFPGGGRMENGQFNGLGHGSQWWSATLDTNNVAWGRYLDYNEVVLRRGSYCSSMCGYFVRCLKDDNTNETYVINKEHVFRVFPNPTNGTIEIILGTTPVREQFVKIYNIQGKEIFSKTFYNLQNTVIDLTGHPSGIYFIRLTINGKVINDKILLE